jgi:RNA polymerase sigma-70 factor (ECF subfamily)
MAIEQFAIMKTLLSERAKVIAYILSLVRQRDLAEDIFQDVCVLALQKQEEIRDRKHLLAWMRVTARFQALNALRKHRRERLPLSDAVLEMLDVHWRMYDDAPNTSLLESLQACLKLLTEKARQLLQERYAEGVDMEEIARRRNRPLNSVYVTLSRAHQALADCLFHRLAQERKGEYG